MDSILTSIKKLLGITKNYTHFDDDIIMHINSVFMVLHQLGLGPEDGYAIQSSDNIWSEFINDGIRVESVKTYVYLKVKLLFDPPQSSSVIEAINRQINELEWRLNVSADPGI